MPSHHPSLFSLTLVSLGILSSQLPPRPVAWCNLCNGVNRDRWFVVMFHACNAGYNGKSISIASKQGALQTAYVRVANSRWHDSRNSHIIARQRHETTEWSRSHVTDPGGGIASISVTIITDARSAPESSILADTITTTTTARPSSSSSARLSVDPNDRWHDMLPHSSCSKSSQPTSRSLIF